MARHLRRDKSGYECPVCVCLLLSFVRGACGHSYGRPGLIGASTRLSHDPGQYRHFTKYRLIPLATRADSRVVLLPRTSPMLRRSEIHAQEDVCLSKVTSL